jgi:hypothetical protein
MSVREIRANERFHATPDAGVGFNFDSRPRLHEHSIRRRHTRVLLNHFDADIL